MPALRLVLDTNVLVSGLAYPASVPGRIVGAWRAGHLKLVLSTAILDELARVLPRLPRAGIGAADARDLADSLLFLADGVDITAIPPDPRLRDAADQPILATLRASQADYLVSGDKDLLALAESYPIVTPAEFWARHGA